MTKREWRVVKGIMSIMKKGGKVRKCPGRILDNTGTIISSVKGYGVVAKEIFEYCNKNKGGGVMGEDRIKSEITFGYKAINSKGEVTVELLPTTLIVSDQSQEGASAHLSSIVNGVLSPALKQIEG